MILGIAVSRETREGPGCGNGRIFTPRRPPFELPAGYPYLT